MNQPNMPNDYRPPMLGTWIKLPAPEIVEIAGLAGFDFVVIDLEHTMLNLETVSAMIGAARLAHVRPFVRVPDHGGSLIKRVLDAGAAGVFVPQVETAEQAREIVRRARFRPLGTRGLSNSGRAGRWGAIPPDEYMSIQNKDIAVVVQIESESAVRDAVAIASVPGVDGIFIGPMDLAASMGVGAASQYYRQLISKLETDCATAGVTLGTACGTDPVAARGLLRRYSMLVMSNDATLLRTAAETLLSAVR